MGRSIKQMAELTMAHLVELALGHAGLHARHQPHPQGHLGTIEGCLLDNTLGTIGYIANDDFVGLIGCITQKITFKYGLRTRQLGQQAVVGIQHSFELLGKWKARILYANHSMILAHLGSVVKTEHIGSSLVEIYVR